MDLHSLITNTLSLVYNYNQHLFIMKQQNPRQSSLWLSHVGNSFSWPEVLYLGIPRLPAPIKDATKGILFIRPCYP